MTSERRPNQWPTTTAHTTRLRLFQATRRPSPKTPEQIISTAWGKIRIKGRLGQQHADVFEAVCYCRDKTAETADGRLKLLVDPARVRARANQVSGSTFRRIIDELMAALIEIIEPANLACQGHLIDHIDKAQRVDGSYITAPNPLGGERHLWRVEIGKAYLHLVAADIWLGYDPQPIATRLNHGISQAIARHILSHRTSPNGGWTLDGLIRAVAGDIDPIRARNFRRRVREDATALATIGISMDGCRVRRLT